MAYETQGVALGEHAPALLAPKDMDLVEVWKAYPINF
jgi:hypothetical protein